MSAARKLSVVTGEPRYVVATANGFAIERRPADFDRCTICVRLLRLMSMERPRKASLAPSSIITMSGRNLSSNTASRLTPPLVVSPLILALRISALVPRLVSCRPSSATQPVLRPIPYSAEMLSPTTRMRAGSESDPGNFAQPGIGIRADNASSVAHLRR